MKGQGKKMTYEEIVGKALIVYAKADATEVTGHLAVQFNVRGEGEGAFYIEVSDGKVDVQPYEYYDRNAIVTVNSDTLIEMLDGKLGIDEAYNDNKVQIEGDLGAALLLKKIAVKEAPGKTIEAHQRLRQRRRQRKRLLRRRPQLKKLQARQQKLRRLQAVRQQPQRKQQQRAQQQRKQQPGKPQKLRSKIK